MESAAHISAVSHPPGPSNFQWIEEGDGSCMPHFTELWNASFLQSHETRHFTEWLESHSSDAEDDIPDSMVASSSSASGVASAASASVDSLGLHHLVTFESDVTDDVHHSPIQTIYDRTDFAIASESICSHHELSELDITLIPPSFGTLLNWKSPIAPCRALGQKRPRDTELDELADRYKRRRMLELRV